MLNSEREREREKEREGEREREREREREKEKERERVHERRDIMGATLWYLMSYCVYVSLPLALRVSRCCLPVSHPP